MPIFAGWEREVFGRKSKTAPISTKQSCCEYVPAYTGTHTRTVAPAFTKGSKYIKIAWLALATLLFRKVDGLQECSSSSRAAVSYSYRVRIVQPGVYVFHDMSHTYSYKQVLVVVLTATATSIYIRRVLFLFHQQLQGQQATVESGRRRRASRSLVSPQSLLAAAPRLVLLAASRRKACILQPSYLPARLIELFDPSTRAPKTPPGCAACCCLRHLPTQHRAVLRLLRAAKAWTHVAQLTSCMDVGRMKSSVTPMSPKAPTSFTAPMAR